MTVNKYVIACTKDWFYKKNKKIKNKKFLLITNKKKLNYNYLIKINPRYIFFPHWSYKIPKIIYKNFICICFHTSPLPYGRGGSPIQNLILDNFKESPVNAIKVEEKIDSGDIILKNKISLKGSLTQIFDRLLIIITKMIFQIIKKKRITYRKQSGKTKIFKRIKKLKSNILNQNFEKIENLHDHIRMRDHKDYPRAYIDLNKYRLYFSNSEFKKSYLSAKVIIKKKK